jgi:non-ribosomal peptide synthase protein (TIGR01720 family)
VHHLAIDGFSWRVLLEDLDHLLVALGTGAPVSLPLKTTAIRRWSRRIAEFASSEEMQEESGFWIERLRAPVPALPLDHPGRLHENTVASERTFSVTLGAADTAAILRRAPGALAADIDAVLLGALAWSIVKWTGDRSLLVHVEGHGREDLFEDVDLSRTIGWFTALYPVRLDLEGASTVAAAVGAVQKQLRAISHHGIGYGLLRYLSAMRLETHPRPEITFNYLGQFDSVFSPHAAFRLVEESTGPTRSPRDMRHHLLGIDAVVVHGRMHVTWSYSENLHQSATIVALAHSFEKALGALILWCSTGTVARPTPKDFPEAGLSQVALDELLTDLSES